MRSLLFPFAKTYRRLDLGSRWWHRLAIVFFVCLLLLFLGVATLGVTEGVSEYSVSADVAKKLGFESQYAQSPYVPERLTYGFKLNGGNIPMVSPEGKMYLVAESDLSNPVYSYRGWKPETLVVDVPDIGAVAFVNVSKNEAEKKGEQLYRGYKAAVKKAYAEAALWSVIFLVGMFYLTQTVYRAIIYIAFGRPKANAASA